MVVITFDTFLRGCSIGLCAAYIWLLFSQGVYLPDAGKDLVVVGVPLSMVAVCLACVVLYFFQSVGSVALRRVPLIVAGVCCSVLTASAPFRMSLLPYEGVVWVLLAANAVLASWWFFACAADVVAHSDQVPSALLGTVIGFVLFWLASLFTFQASMAFIALMPLAGCIILGYLLAKDGAATSSVPSAADSAAEGNAIFAHSQSSRSLAEGKQLRGVYWRFLGALFLFLMLATLLRSFGLSFTGQRGGYSVGATLSFALCACLCAVMLLLWRHGKTILQPTDIYIVSAPGICLGALVMLLTDVNDIVVRTVEDISIIALFAACAIVVDVCVRKSQLPIHQAFASALGFASLGALAGWLIDNVMVQRAGFDAASTIWLLILLFLVTLYYFFGFSPQQYSRYVEDGRFTLYGGHVVKDVPLSVEPMPEKLPTDLDASEQTSERSHITFKEAATIIADEAQLTRREKDVLFCIIKGWSDQRIADELFVSYNTVRAHVRNIYMKTECHNREELLDIISAAQNTSLTD